MEVYEPFITRKKRAQSAGRPVVYQYDILPGAFRGQVIHILTRALGTQTAITTVRVSRAVTYWTTGVSLSSISVATNCSARMMLL